jgi:hypothetical protein
MESRLLGILAFEWCTENYNGALPLAARSCPNEQLLNRLTEGGAERSGPPAVLFGRPKSLKCRKSHILAGAVKLTAESQGKESTIGLLGPGELRR